MGWRDGIFLGHLQVDSKGEFEDQCRRKNFTGIKFYKNVKESLCINILNNINLGLRKKKMFSKISFFKKKGKIGLISNTDLPLVKI